MKSRHKITLLFTLLVTAILLVVSLSVYYFSYLDRKEAFVKRLKGRANNNAQIFSYFKEDQKAVLDRINTSIKELLPNKTIGIYSLTGERRYSYITPGYDTVPVSRRHIDRAIAGGEYYFQVQDREVLALHYREEGQGFVVVISAYDHDGWAQLRQLKQIFVISLLFGTLISLVAGHVFSKQLLNPVSQIIKEVNDISSHNLSHRIHTRGAQEDELNQLANTFNELLDRIQESFESQRRFISNASHELSTPLTSISSQLQVTLQRNRDTSEYRQVMQSVQEDVVQMRQLTKSLLEMAKTGSQGSIELNEIRVDEVLFRVMAEMKKLNHRYEVELSFSEFPDDETQFLVFGNTDLLYIAVRNIVENGCKYSSDHRAIVDLYFEKGMAVIDVKSIGKTVAREEMKDIFKPFYRSSNAVGTSGFGLGLALAKRIVGLHKGTLKVESDHLSGMDFIVTLPTLSVKA